MNPILCHCPWLRPPLASPAPTDSLMDLQIYSFHFLVTDVSSREYFICCHIKRKTAQRDMRYDLFALTMSSVCINCDRVNGHQLQCSDYSRIRSPIQLPHHLWLPRYFRIHFTTHCIGIYTQQCTFSKWNKPSLLTSDLSITNLFNNFGVLLD